MHACQQYSHRHIFGIGKNTLDASSRSNEKGNKSLNPADGNGILKFMCAGDPNTNHLIEMSDASSSSNQEGKTYQKTTWSEGEWSIQAGGQ
jgi:hypothetical protein